MTVRRLVTLRKINEIKPIQGADMIELAIADKWQCVVKKGEFKTGNSDVSFEIVSYLPLEERYEFLRKSSHKKVTDQLQGQHYFIFNIRDIEKKLPLTVLNGRRFSTNWKNGYPSAMYRLFPLL